MIMDAMVETVTFESAGRQLAGSLHRPVNGPAPVPGLVVCHGFGGNSDGAGYRILTLGLAAAGYVVLRFDFRGCGASGGEPGRVIFEEEVEDLKAAVTFLAAQPGVDAGRIAAIGASMGGSVVIYGAATDARIRACVASGAVADGERFCRWQHRDDAGWERFLTRLEEARQYRTATGRSRMMNRFEIVFIPEQMRQGLPPGSRMEFPAETAISMLGFKAEAVVGRIAPRPLLLLHPAGDEVVPKMESIQLAASAGAPCELQILAGDNHFAFSEPEVMHIILSWLARHLPVRG
jgi:dipeptidyl aminopeptidase/acylaminoacyl peptidase